jgi:hypothetical protein
MVYGLVDQDGRREPHRANDAKQARGRRYQRSVTAQNLRVEEKR